MKYVDKYFHGEIEELAMHLDGAAVKLELGDAPVVEGLVGLSAPRPGEPTDRLSCSALGTKQDINPQTACPAPHLEQNKI